MKRNASRRVPRRSTAEFDVCRVDALGALQLVLAAKDSLHAHCKDRVGADILEQCIAHLKQRYDLSDPEVSGVAARPESSLPALVRLLVYVHTDAVDNLNDVRCAELLNCCVRHLLQSYDIRQEHLYRREVFTSH
jgi:hypothetical protein